MPLDHAADPVQQQTLTRDAFLGGRLLVSQPGTGFRAGLDSVLLGAATSPASRSVLDLGAGAGTASLVALADLPHATATLVENDEEIAAIAVSNLAANGFAERGRVIVLDVTAKGSARADAGLPSDHYSSVIANPPFFDPARGTAPASGRAAARHMVPEALDRWVKAAATHAAPEGEVIFILPAASLPTAIAAFTSRFGAVCLLPLTPREGQPAHRVLLRGIKGSRAPFTLMASRALHETDGRNFRAEFDAIFRGRARLVW